MNFKRWLSAMLALIVLVSCLSGTVFAANDDITPITPRWDYFPDPNDPDSYTPPVFFDDGSATPEPEVYHTSVEDAAAQLRDAMVNRETNIVIGFQTESPDNKWAEIYDKALEHTGAPTQGDYIFYQRGSYSVMRSGYEIAGISYLTFTCNMTYYTTAEQEDRMDAAVKELLDALDVYDASDYEKVCAIYDYITENIVYDDDGLYEYEQTRENKKIFTAYAALVDGTAVCQGYANLFYRLALELGVDSRIISGIGNGGGHAWNIVALNNLYYDVDATWDASWKQAGLDYNYFLRCDDNFERHTRDESFNAPEFHAAYPMATADYVPSIANGTCGIDLSWSLHPNGTLNISGNGAMADYANKTNSPWSGYGSEITSVVIEKGVTTIGSNAFSFYASSNNQFYPADTDPDSDIDVDGGFGSRGKNKIKSVTIPATVTKIGNNAFANIADLDTVIFGGTKSQWNTIQVGTGNDALSNAEILYIGEIKFASAAPGLYNDIAMYYTIDKSTFDALGITNPYLIVEFNNTKTVLTDYTISDDGSQYTFGFFNIAPNQMGDTITATLYATYGDEVYEGATLNYSVALYCTRMLNNSAVVNNAAYAELRTLLVDLLNYGAAAQIYTGYKTGSLVNASLTATQASWGTSDTPALSSKTAITSRIENPSVNWKTAILVLDDSVTIRLIFTGADVINTTMRISTDSSPYDWIIYGDNFIYDRENDYYYIDFGELHAGQMRECIYATVYDGDTAVSHTLRYSIESYAASFAANTTYPTVAELVKAMMRYGDAAYNFVN